MARYKFRLFLLLSTCLITSGSFSQTYFNVKDYGAKGNGKTDDRISIQKTIDAAAKNGGGVVFFPAGTYMVKSYNVTSNYLENYMIRLQSDIKIEGSGNKSVIKLGSHLYDKDQKSANAHLFFGHTNRNVSFSNLVIDMNGKNNLAPKEFIKNYAAIFSKYGSDYYIGNLTIRNTAGRTMLNIMGNGERLVVENCRFLNGGPFPGNGLFNPNQGDFSFVYSEWDSTRILNNHIEQENVDIALKNFTGGIEIHGNDCEVRDNYVKGCWPGIFITSSKSQKMKNVLVRNNKFIDCLVGVSFWVMDTMQNVEISQNDIQLTYPRNNKLRTVAGIWMPNGNFDKYADNLANNAPVEGLKITDNIINIDSVPIMSAGMVIHSLKNSLIEKNSISGMNYGGIIIQGSKWGMGEVSITDNIIADFRPAVNGEAVAGFFVITDTYSPKASNAPGFKNIVISNNKCMGEGLGIKGSEKFFGSFVALPRTMGKEVRFINNHFSDKSLSVYQIDTN